MEEYDPVTNKWKVSEPMKTTRFSFASTVLDSYIYAIGGGGGALVLNQVKSFSFDLILILTRYYVR